MIDSFVFYVGSSTAGRGLVNHAITIIISTKLTKSEKIINHW
jgi:hypothetical protein